MNKTSPTSGNVNYLGAGADQNSVALPSCPVCGLRTTRLLCKVGDYTIWRCPESATDFVWPMPEDEAIEVLYDREAWFEGGEIGGYTSYDQQTEHSIPIFDQVLATFGKKRNLSLLDIGCGYGTHLALAADRGWKCFGIEVSDHARKLAHKRHGTKLFIVDDVNDMMPYEFDLIILFDVLEHLKDPYAPFYSLFSKGSITPNTKVVITTPNARGSAATANPAGWTYRHPPSHLVYFSASSLHRLLSKLRFTNIKISGLHPIATATQNSYGDETSVLNDALAGYEGLLCEASGSDFRAFMHERYVPGTWSKITEYEHIPRYIFAREFADGMQMLDFGCGTGYGAALLAEVAESVLGVDIDESALQWARDSHRFSNLRFEGRSDLGAGLPDHSFDLITCFEMIEHVDELAQVDAIRNFSRLLKRGGLLIISTPNPEVTKNYGANPYHIREMCEEEFKSLLARHFANVTVLRQWIRPAISIDVEAIPDRAPTFFDSVLHGGIPRQYPQPAAFIAVCSNASLPEIRGTYYLDSSFDYIADTMKSARRFDLTQRERYELQKKLSQEGRTWQQRLGLKLRNVLRSTRRNRAEGAGTSR